MRVGSRLIGLLTVAGVVMSLAGAAAAQSAPKKPRPAKRGGYSYTTADTINTYGNSRTKYGSSDVYRDTRLDSQTAGGPFDHGFFFNSGMGRNGGESPYQR